jgi:hypothetical protein
MATSIAGKISGRQSRSFSKWSTLRLSAYLLRCLCPTKESVWNSLVKKHNLLNYTFREAAAWPFGEAVFNLGYDVMSDTTKSRRFGFHEWVETEEMLMRLFRQFQTIRFIPS